MGRPRRIEVAVAVDSDYAERVQAAREAHTAADPLVSATRLDRPADAQETIRCAMEGLAVETAALLHDRLVTEARGGDTSVIASRRIEGLNRMAQLCLVSKKLDLLALDERCPQFERVERAWIDMLREVARDVLPTETGKVALDRLVAAMAAWRASLDAPPTVSP